MENRHLENTPPEEQPGWGAYATPPPNPLGTAGNALSGGPNKAEQMSLCDRVRDLLPALLENDGDIRPEMAATLYGHLSACPGCAQEFNEMQRVVALLESLGPAPMPADYSDLILRRIRTEIGPLTERAGPFQSPSVAGNGQQPLPSAAASSVFGEAAATAPTETERAVAAALSPSGLREEGLVTLPNLRLWERLTLTGIFSALMAFLLSTAWGREMLGSSLESIQAWFGQIGEVLRRVPVVNWLAAAVFAALAQAGDLLEETYRSLGGTETMHLGMEIAILATIGCFLVARKRYGRMRGI
ncbi:MAG TPA: hypothetical protein VFA07_04335 [Chthonomonadaceae bacterium]|nr:hypothetical protein [Chthonomonadaceae bacterium]